MTDYEAASTFAQHLHKREQAQQLLIQLLIQTPVAPPSQTHQDAMAGLTDAYVHAQRQIDSVVAGASR
jgi:hypothetical protein